MRYSTPSGLLFDMIAPDTDLTAEQQCRVMAQLMGAQCWSIDEYRKIFRDVEPKRTVCFVRFPADGCDYGYAHWEDAIRVLQNYSPKK